MSTTAKSTRGKKNGLLKSKMRAVREPNSTKLFLNTLWKMVEDPKCDAVISWNPNDTASFMIHDLKEFRERTLKKYYAAKWNSFRRQLYFYGFKGTRDVKWSHKDLDHSDVESLNNVQRVKKQKRSFEEMYLQNAMMMQQQMFSNFMQPNPMMPPHVGMFSSNSISPPQVFSPGMTGMMQLPKVSPPNGYIPALKREPLASPPGEVAMMPNMNVSPPNLFQPGLPPAKRMKIADNPMFGLLTAKSGSAENEAAVAEK